MAADAPEETRPSRWNRLRARPWLAGGAAALMLGGVVFVLVWFQPQALLFDTVVDEEFPAIDDAAADETPETGETDPPDDAREDEEDEPDPETDDEEDAEADEPAGPVMLATGSFESRNRYTVTGQTSVFELEDGSRTLRLEDFESTNGPDLYVYLTAADHADTDEELDRDVVDLGELRGNVGNQNYEVPADVDLNHYDTVVIWCLRFTSSFGAADIAPA